MSIERQSAGDNSVTTPPPPASACAYTHAQTLNVLDPLSWVGVRRPPSPPSSERPLPATFSLYTDVRSILMVVAFKFSFRFQGLFSSTHGAGLNMDAMCQMGSKSCNGGHPIRRASHVAGYKYVGNNDVLVESARALRVHCGRRLQPATFVCVLTCALDVK